MRYTLRRLALALLALPLAFALPGCEKDGDPAEVVGKWVLDKDSIDDAAYNAVRAAAERSQRRPPEDQIESIAKQFAEKLRTAPVEVEINADGTLAAGDDDVTQRVEGTWVYKASGELLVESPGARDARKFQFQGGALVVYPKIAGLKVIRYVRKK
ncbi:MAG: hypothetical protein JNM86_08405 [Phycisphaerae bacterium]|nr:hypothetical protein [Phycisphaerae bacterium]